jgi:hypothetical protein
MRLMFLSIAPLLVAATVTPIPHAAPQVHGKLSAPSGSSPKNCRSQIETVREERGLPKLHAKEASSDPLLIYAVDRTVDGCEVLVVADKRDDIRPLPEFSDKARLRPAH